jgi:hypothetical protein
LKSLGKKGQRAQQKKILSTVIAELLKLDPDTTAATARLQALDATGVEPSAELLRAREMLDAVKAHKTRRHKAKGRVRVFGKKAHPRVLLSLARAMTHVKPPRKPQGAGRKHSGAGRRRTSG